MSELFDEVIRSQKRAQQALENMTDEQRKKLKSILNDKDNKDKVINLLKKGIRKDEIA